MNDQQLKALPAPDKGNRIHYGMGKPGLGLRITAGDARAWILNYTAPSGVRRRATLGRYPNLSLAQAQTKADEWTARLTDGVLVRENGTERHEKIDPLEEKRRERSKAQSTARVMTVKELSEIWWERHALINKRKSSLQSDRCNLDNWILPKLGRMRLTEVTRGDMEALKARMKDTPVQANRTLALFSALMNYAQDHEWIARNPAKGVKRYRENQRTVSLTRAQLDRLYQVIEEEARCEYSHDNRDTLEGRRRAAQAIKLLVWTGARRGEVLGAKWSEFDLARGLWTRTAERNKQGTPTVTPLNSLALNLLREMKSTADGAAPSERLFNGMRLRNFWKHVTREVELPKLHLHDLRHVFATLMLEGGAPLDSIAALLGHSDTVMTKIYATRSQEALQKIAAMGETHLAPRALPAPAKRTKRKAA
jgi:integrase